MDKILTVVVPTYNMEEYLHRSLGSLIVPPEQMKELEVLVINDGSKDSSSAIAHEYQNKYPETFRVIDKENGNYGSCVNRGLAEAKGKFFRLLDADDWFCNDQLSILLTELHKLPEEVDVVFNNVYLQSDKPELLMIKNAEYNKVYDFDEFDFRKTGNYNNIFAVMGLTYRKVLLDSVHLQLQTGISYTDNEYCFYPLTKSQRFVFLPINLFNYFIGRDGQTISPASILKNYANFYKIGKRMIPVYLKISSGLSEARKSSMFKFLHAVLYPLYEIPLKLDLPYDAERIAMLKEIEAMVSKDSDLKAMTNTLKYRHFSYVQLWRYTGIRVRSLDNAVKNNSILRALYYCVRAVLRIFKHK